MTNPGKGEHAFKQCSESPIEYKGALENVNKCLKAKRDEQRSEAVASATK